jgi:predicted O-methyltransferase YrrM
MHNNKPDYLDFCPTLKRMVRDGVYPNGNESISVGANSTENNLHILRELIRAKKPVRTLEIGLANGASALVILASLNEFVAANHQHTAIDPFQKDHWKSVGLCSVQTAGFQDHFRFMEDFSSLALPRLVEARDCFDFIYVDGSHAYDNVFVDHYYGLRLLKRNGVILFDDCTTGDVAAVIRFIIQKQKHILRELDLNPFRNPNRSWKRKLGNMLGRSQIRAFAKLGDWTGFLNL